MDVITVHFNTVDSEIVSDFEEDDVLIDFREIEKDWNDTMALEPIRFSTSHNQIGNRSLLLPVDLAMENSTRVGDDWWFYDASAFTERIQSINSQHSDEFPEEETTPFSLELTPINPSVKMSVVTRTDVALEENFRSSSLPESFYESMAQIFAVASPPHEKEMRTVFSEVKASSALPKPSFCASRQTSVISISSYSTSAECTRSMSDRWNDRYHDLKAFVKKHGHCHVPIKYKDNILLSRWIKRQRYQWKLKQEGRQSSLTDARQVKLEKLGFLWDVRSIVWDIRYQELVEFHKRHGHCNVSINCKDFPKLGTWVKCQRRQYCLMISGHKTHMTPSRVQLLQKVGFSWSGKQADK
ncbi:helicase domain protein [Nitzschia inconspicua]|uniref:Helicase domain protein n=1 Tax=Nitzschia inconspicua TaxID=303405 RepID=A0A9K3L404_9STRA|nr:helicase domain protein [Nitzschia inconspicua]